MDDDGRDRDLELHRATTDADAQLVARLHQLYLHDLSQFRDSWIQADGTFRAHDSASFTDGSDPDRLTWIFRVGDRPVGFAQVRGAETHAPDMEAFFVVRRMRGSGIARDAALRVLRAHAGPWTIAFQEANAGAARFWRRIAMEAFGTAWREELRPVPGKPHIAPDVWLLAERTVGEA